MNNHIIIRVVNIPSFDNDRIQYYKEQIEHNNDLKCMFLLGKSYVDVHYKTEEGIKYLNMAVEMGCYDSTKYLANYYLNEKCYEESIVYLNKLVDIDPKPNLIKTTIAMCHASLENYEKMFEILNALVNENDPNAMLLLGNHYKFIEKNIDKMFEYYKMCLDNNNTEVYYYYAIYYKEIGNIDEMLKNYINGFNNECEKCTIDLLKYYYSINNLTESHKYLEQSFDFLPVDTLQFLTEYYKNKPIELYNTIQPFYYMDGSIAFEISCLETFDIIKYYKQCHLNSNIFRCNVCNKDNVFIKPNDYYDDGICCICYQRYYALKKIYNLNFSFDFKIKYLYQILDIYENHNLNYDLTDVDIKLIISNYYYHVKKDETTYLEMMLSIQDNTNVQSNLVLFYENKMNYIKNKRKINGELNYKYCEKQMIHYLIELANKGINEAINKLQTFYSKKLYKYYLLLDKIENKHIKILEIIDNLKSNKFVNLHIQNKNNECICKLCNNKGINVYNNICHICCVDLDSISVLMPYSIFSKYYENYERQIIDLFKNNNVNLDLTDIKIVNLLYLYYAMKRQFTRAEELIKIANKDSVSYMTMAKVNIKLKKFDDALKCYLKAIEMDNNINIMFLNDCNYFKNYNFDETEQKVLSFYQSKPNDIKILHSLIEFYEYKNNQEKAKEFIIKAIQLNSQKAMYKLINIFIEKNVDENNKFVKQRYIDLYLFLINIENKSELINSKINLLLKNKMVINYNNNLNNYKDCMVCFENQIHLQFNCCYKHEICYKCFQNMQRCQYNCTK